MSKDIYFFFLEYSTLGFSLILHFVIPSQCLNCLFLAWHHTSFRHMPHPAWWSTPTPCCLTPWLNHLISLPLTPPQYPSPHPQQGSPSWWVHRPDEAGVSIDSCCSIRAISHLLSGGKTDTTSTPVILFACFYMAFLVYTPLSITPWQMPV